MDRHKGKGKSADIRHISVTFNLWQRIEAAFGCIYLVYFFLLGILSCYQRNIWRIMTNLGNFQTVYGIVWKEKGF